MSEAFLAGQDGDKVKLETGSYKWSCTNKASWSQTDTVKLKRKPSVFLIRIYAANSGSNTDQYGEVTYWSKSAYSFALWDEIGVKTYNDGVLGNNVYHSIDRSGTDSYGYYISIDDNNVATIKLKDKLTGGYSAGTITWYAFSF